jgi:Ca2+-binding EF-hand superfamily protein
MRVTTVNIPIQRLEQLFYAFDLDMDGYIDQFELSTLINKSYTLFEHTLSLDSWSALVRTLALHMDSNADGMLAINEVITAFSQI